jgi:hypothetical protein
LAWVFFNVWACEKLASNIWQTLEKRFTSISMSNILNLMIELHNIKKDANPVSVYVQKIKESKGKLPTVDVNIDNEELLHIALKGLPKEFHALC